jgi:hypothetical protein
VGPGAGEMITEAVLAIEMAATVTDIALTIYPPVGNAHGAGGSLPQLGHSLLSAAKKIPGPHIVKHGDRESGIATTQ